MAKGKGNTAAVATQIITPAVQNCGVQLWDVRFEKEGPDWFLRVFIDKKGGVNIEDCETVSRAIDPLLDEADPISQSYILEVSSPGLGRKLTQPAHFARFAGEKVCAHFIRPENGAKEITGILVGFENGILTLIEKENTPVSFELEKTSFVKLCDDEDLF